MWRGPGTLMNSSVYHEAVELWHEHRATGKCPQPVEVSYDWLRGYPTSQFAKLARQLNLLYTAVMDCSGAVCNRDMQGAFDRGWCASDTKKMQHVEVDVEGKLLPTIWAVYDEHLRWYAPVL